MSITRIADCIIAAHEAFQSNDPKQQKAGLLLVRTALMSEKASDFVAALEEAVQQFDAPNSDLEDIDRMGDDPSMAESAPFQPDDLVEDDGEEPPPDENADAASPADEELTDTQDDEDVDTESDIQGDVSEEMGSVGLVTRAPLLVPAAVRRAAATINRIKSVGV